MSTLPRQGDPNSIVCGCGLVRTVQHSDGEHVHRLCRICDTPDIRGLVATWEQNK